MGTNSMYKIWHEGNLAKGVDGAWWGKMGYIGSDGVTEIGKYLDFHATHTDTADYSVRLTATPNLLSVSCTFDVVAQVHNVANFSGMPYLGQNYAYINLNYNGSRRGYLLWDAAGVSINADTGHSITLRAGANSAIYLSGNLESPNSIAASVLRVYGSGGSVTLDSRTTGATYVIYNQTGQELRLWHSTWGDIFHFHPAGVFKLYGTNGTGEVGPQNGNYFHFMTDRPQFYFQKGVIVDGNFGSYSADMIIHRAGVNRINLKDWGVYINNHLTIEDVFAIANYQAGQPLTPASGLKIYAYNSSGNLQLRVRFSNGVDRQLQLGTS